MYVEVALGGRQAGVPERLLDQRERGAMLERVGRVRVTQPVSGDRGVDAGAFGGPLNDLRYAGSSERTPIAATIILQSALDRSTRGEVCRREFKLLRLRQTEIE